MEILHAVAPVTSIVDPEAAQAALLGPGPDRVRMNPQKPGGLRDGNGRRLRVCGRVMPPKTEELVNPPARDARRTSQNLP